MRLCLLALIPTVLGCLFAKQLAHQKLPASHASFLEGPKTQFRRLLQNGDFQQCPDDPYGALAGSQTDCPGLVAALGCTTDLNTVSPEAPVGSLIRKICPKSCSWCYLADKSRIVGDDGQAAPISRLLDYNGAAIDMFSKVAADTGRDMCYFTMQPLPSPPKGFNTKTGDCGDDAPCKWTEDSLTYSDEAIKYLKEIDNLGQMAVERWNALVTEDGPAYGGWVTWGNKLEKSNCDQKIRCEGPTSDEVNWPTSSVIMRVTPNNKDELTKIMRSWRRSADHHLPQIKADSVHKFGYGAAGGQGLTFKLIPCDVIPDKLKYNKQEGTLTDKFNEMYNFWKGACNAFYDPTFSPNGDYSKCPARRQGGAPAPAPAPQIQDKIGQTCSVSSDCGENERCHKCNMRRLLFGGASVSAAKCNTCQPDCESTRAQECANSGCAGCEPCYQANYAGEKCDLCKTTCKSCDKFRSCKHEKSWCWDADPVKCMTYCGNCDGTNCYMPNKECKPCEPVVKVCGPSCDNPISASIAQKCQAACAPCIPCIGADVPECAACEPCSACMSFIKCFSGQFAGLTTNPGNSPAGN